MKRPGAQCRICQSPADLEPYMIQCRAHKGHRADYATGIWSDCTRPDDDAKIPEGPDVTAAKEEP